MKSLSSRLHIGLIFASLFFGAISLTACADEALRQSSNPNLQQSEDQPEKIIISKTFSRPPRPFPESAPASEPIFIYDDGYTDKVEIRALPSGKYSIAYIHLELKKDLNP
ncbi:MAG: hypothetical protein KAX88_01385 [Rhodoferax sp.]|jgi:hypothetical protein|nr:hypothetical protein [Rhodoferax sp.]